MAITVDGTNNTITGVTSITATTMVPSTITPAAGTTSFAPIDLAPGTNLSVPSAGAFEYDGTDLYFTPAALQRGLVASPQYYAIGQTAITGPTIINTGQTATFTAATPTVCTVTTAPSVGTIVVFTGGVMPTPLASGVQYFVVNVVGATFNVAATRGGAALATSTTGSGTITATFYSSIFNVGVSLTANTRYAYEIYAATSKSAAAANALQYAITGVGAGGTAPAFNFHAYTVLSNTAATAVTLSATNQMSNYIATGFATPVTVTPASPVSASATNLLIKGVLENGATAVQNVNFTLGYTTAAPTTSLFLQGSYVSIYPIPGTLTTNTSVGSWV